MSSTSSTNHIKTVAIVGSSGRIGSAFTDALLATGKHTVTCLRHSSSKGSVPSGAKTATVDYSSHASLVAALKGQDFLIITLGVRAPPELHGQIVAAAAEAGVEWVMPNVYGSDIENERLVKDSPWLQGGVAKCRDVEEKGMKFVCLVCGFWYEWSLGLGEQWYGFQIKDRKVTFFDDGTTKINTSTWLQCGRAIASLLSLPITHSTTTSPSSTTTSPSSPVLSDFTNAPLRISSFLVSQRDMLDSLHRVLGTTDSDWTITHEASDKRVRDGAEEMKRGEMTGFAKQMYSRMFYPNGDGNYEEGKGLRNQVLGLPEEELDEATRRTVEMVERGWNPFAE